MTDAAPSLGARLMGAFIDIEDHMTRSVYGSATGAPGRFRAVLAEYAKKARRHLPVHHERTLLTLSELRNLLAHTKYVDGMPVAEPSVQAVHAIEKIRDDLMHPRTVLSVLSNPKPTTAHPDDAVAATLHTMYQNDFSQMPVYAGKQYLGLLTTNTVARWLADQLERHDGLAEDAPIRDVLPFAEGIENVLHRPRTLSVTETIWEFTTAATTGRPVTALILTNSGQPDESPLGIVVANDLTRLPG